MKKFLQKFLGDKAGASAAEYALILAVVGLGVVGAFTTLGERITSSVEDAADTIADAPTG
jgi:pilus assembly protein Flp/PilA